MGLYLLGHSSGRARPRGAVRAYRSPARCEMAERRRTRRTGARTEKRKGAACGPAANDLVRGVPASESAAAGGGVLLQHVGELQHGVLPAEHSATVVFAQPECNHLAGDSAAESCLGRATVRRMELRSHEGAAAPCVRANLCGPARAGVDAFDARKSD